MNLKAHRLAREADRVRDWIERELPLDSLGRPLEVFVELPSTNDRLKELALGGAPEGAAVIALSQTHGRGQQGRRWISPPGKGLYLSVLLRPAPENADGAWLAMAAATAVADTLSAAGIPQVSIKPPNDVMTGGRKIAGVLIEPRIGGSGMEFAVVGIGLNLFHTPEDFLSLPPERPATSCRMEGVPIELADAALRVLRALMKRYRQAIHSPRCGDLRTDWAALRGCSSTSCNERKTGAPSQSTFGAQPGMMRNGNGASPVTA